jgi:hypothetical protein
MHGKQPTNEGFSITQEDSDILKQYLDEFKHANTSDRTNLIDKVMGELYLLRPANLCFDKKNARVVCRTSSQFVSVLFDDLENTQMVP